MSTNDKLPVPQEPNLPQGSGVPANSELVLVDAAVDLAKEAMICFERYAECREHEITERQRISAQLTYLREQINSAKEISIHLIDKSFEEREKLYSKMDMALAVATKLGDLPMMKLCMDYIKDIYMSAPDTTGIVNNLFSERKQLP